MGNRKGTTRRKTRKLMKKHNRQKGKISLTSYFKEYKDGDRVALKAEPAVQKGLYHLRFYGKNGIVRRKQGDCYEIEIYDGNKKKILITHPIHIKSI